MVTSAQLYGVAPCSLGEGYACFEEKYCLYPQGGKDGRTIQLHGRTMEPKSSHGPIIRRDLHNIRALNHGISSYHSTDNCSTGPFVHAIGLNGYNEMIIQLNIYAINYRTSLKTRLEMLSAK